MQVVRRKRISAVDLRARVPALARALALFLLIGGGIFVGVSYYKMRHNKPFRMKSEGTALSKEITGIIKFDGNVQVETHDALNVKTESILYYQDSDVAETSQPVTFERENVSGRATGAMVDDKNKRLELRSEVEVTVTPDALK